MTDEKMCDSVITRIRLITYLLCFPVLSGCGFHLYDAADDAVAKSAKNTFAAANVDKYISDERAVLLATNERDLLSTKRNVQAERDAAIIFALTGSQQAQTVLKAFEDRMIALGYPQDVPTQRILNTLPDLLQQAVIKRDEYLLAAPAGTPLPALPPTDGDQDIALESGGDAVVLFYDYMSTAAKYQDGLNKLQSIGDGLLGQVNRQLGIGYDTDKQVSGELQAAQKELDHAVNEYKVQVAGGTKTWDELTAYRKDIERALAKFDQIVPKLEPAAKAVGLEDLLAEVPLKRMQLARSAIGDFLSAFPDQQSSATTRPSDAQTAGQVAAVLLKAGQQVHDASVHAKLVPLLFHQQRLQLEADRLARMADRGRQRLELLSNLRNAYVAEAQKLLAASQALKRAAHADPSKGIVTLLQDSTAKADTIHSLFVFAESIAVDKLHEEQVQVALIGLDHDEALDASEYALSLWKQTIASPLDELQGYYASGLKPDEVAHLVEAAGITGVAVGVNR